MSSTNNQTCNYKYINFFGRSLIAHHRGWWFMQPLHFEGDPLSCRRCSWRPHRPLLSHVAIAHRRCTPLLQMEGFQAFGKWKWRQTNMEANENGSKREIYLWWVWCRHPFRAHKKMRENPFAHRDEITKEENLK